MSNNFTISGFDRILVSKTNPEDLIIAAPFNPERKPFLNTILSDLVPANERIVGMCFNTLPLPNFKEDVDAVITSTSGTGIVRAGVDLIGFKAKSKSVIAIDPIFASEHYEIIDTHSSYMFNWDGIRTRALTDENGFIKSEIWCSPYQKEGYWAASYIPFHNLFTDSKFQRIEGTVLTRRNSHILRREPQTQLIEIPNTDVLDLLSTTRFGVDIKVWSVRYERHLTQSEYFEVTVHDVHSAYSYTFGPLKFFMEVASND